MERNLTVVGVAAVVALAVGCGLQFLGGGATGGVAVIDLDRVAQELGRDVEMANEIQQTGQQYKQKLETVALQAADKLKKVRDGLGEAPTEDQQKQFQLMTYNTNINFKKLQQQVGAKLNQEQTQLVAKFRDDVKPYASDVAKHNGLPTVVTRNDSVVFSHEETVDITDQVIEQMRAAGLASSAQPIAAATPQPEVEQGSSNVQLTSGESTEGADDGFAPANWEQPASTEE